MIDLHSHLLPGLDDGARDLDETVAMARAMAADGVRAVAATPHVRDDWPTTPEAMEETLAAARAAVQTAGISLEVLPGGELALDHLARFDDMERARFGLGGNPLLLLVEFPYWGWPLALVQTVWELCSAGVVPVIAHPERNAEVQERPDRLREVVHAGAVVQLTAASLDGRLGTRAALCARALLDLRLAHLVASDAHGPALRKAGLSGAGRALGDERLGRWLTEDVPLALITGTPLPERPVTTKRGRFRR